MGDEQPNAQVSGSHKDRLSALQKAAKASAGKERSTILGKTRGGVAREIRDIQRKLRKAAQTSAQRQAEQASASVRRREGKIHRALATDRFYSVIKAKATPVVHTELVLTEEPGTRRVIKAKATPVVHIELVLTERPGTHSVMKVAPKPATRAAAEPNVEGPEKPVLTGSNSLVGFFRSGQGDLSRTVKDRARRKKGTGNERSGTVAE